MQEMHQIQGVGGRATTPLRPRVTSDFGAAGVVVPQAVAPAVAVKPHQMREVPRDAGRQGSTETVVANLVEEGPIGEVEDVRGSGSIATRDLESTSDQLLFQ